MAERQDRDGPLSLTEEQDEGPKKAEMAEERPDYVKKEGDEAQKIPQIPRRRKGSSTLDSRPRYNQSNTNRLGAGSPAPPAEERGRPPSPQHGQHSGPPSASKRLCNASRTRSRSRQASASNDSDEDGEDTRGSVQARRRSARLAAGSAAGDAEDRPMAAFDMGTEGLEAGLQNLAVDKGEEGSGESDNDFSDDLIPPDPDEWWNEYRPASPPPGAAYLRNPYRFYGVDPACVKEPGERELTWEETREVLCKEFNLPYEPEPEVVFDARYAALDVKPVY